MDLGLWPKVWVWLKTNETHLSKCISLHVPTELHRQQLAKFNSNKDLPSSFGRFPKLAPSIYLQNHLYKWSFNLHTLKSIDWTCCSISIYFISLNQTKQTKHSAYLKISEFCLFKKSFPIFHVIQLLHFPQCFVKAEAAEPMAKARDCSCWGKLRRMSIPNCQTTGKPLPPVPIFLNATHRFGANSANCISGNITKFQNLNASGTLGGDSLPFQRSRPSLVKCKTDWVFWSCDSLHNNLSRVSASKPNVTGARKASKYKAKEARSNVQQASSLTCATVASMPNSILWSFLLNSMLSFTGSTGWAMLGRGIWPLALSTLGYRGSSSTTGISVFLCNSRPFCLINWANSE